jgi:hypothetical protein
MESLGIPGFGTDLIRIDFPPPVRPEPAWGFGKPLHPELESIVCAGAAAQHDLLGRCLDKAGACLAWPENENATDASLPWRNNLFLPILDMVALFGILAEIKPQRYIEIGSGMSTRVAGQARNQAVMPMSIFSIDPSPRVDVSRLCDEVFRKRLEDFSREQLVEMSGEGSVIFFDGSHRCFPGSDVTVFFMEVLPRLKPGTIVQIHDIYLPADYSAAAAERLWSEQYLLAAYLLGGGRGCRVMLPCHYLATMEPTKSVIESRLGRTGGRAFSLWMQIEGSR